MADEKTLAALTVRIGANIEAFSSGLAKAEKRLAKMEKNFQAVGEKLSKNITLPLMAIGGYSVVQAAKLETLETAFVSMTGSVEGAKNMVSELTKFAAKTPFEMEGIGGAAKILLSFGTAAKDVIPTLTTIGDIAAGANIPLDEMAVIYGKIKTKGKAMTEEIMQMAERGIPIIDVLAQKFNLPKEAIFKMAEQGKISFPMVQEALQSMTTGTGVFANQMEKQSGTLAGLWSSMTDAISGGAAKIGLSISDAFSLKESMKTFTAWIEGLATKFASLSGETQKTIIIVAGIAAALGPVILGFSKLVGVVKGVAGSLKLFSAFMAHNPFTIWIVAIGAAIAAITILWNECAGFRAVVKYVAEGAAAFFQKAWIVIKEGAELMWLAIKTYFTAIPQAAQAIWAIIKRVLKGENIGDAIKDEFGKIITNVSDQAKVIRTKYSAELSKIEAPNFKSILAAERAKSGAEQAGEDIAGSFNAGFDATIKAPAVGGVAVKQRDTTPVQSMNSQSVGSVGAGIGIADSVGLEIGRLKENAEKLKNVAMEMKDSVGRVFVEMGDIIKSSMNDAFTTFGEQIGSLMAGTSSMGDFFSSMLGVVIGFCKSLGEALIAAGTGALAFKKLMMSPWLAIAAGVALVALSSVVSNLLAGGPSGSGGGSGSGGEVNISSVPALASGGIATKPTLALIGDSKTAVPHREAIVPLDSNMFGNIQVTGRIVASGRDLMVIIENEKKRQNNLG